MANMQKYKLNELVPVVRENCRIEWEAANVEKALTPNNYVLSQSDDPLGAIKDAVAVHNKTVGRKLRKDAVLMFSWVVTAPLDLRPEDERKFFEAAHQFLCNRYGGEQNCAIAVVHKDEPKAQAHLHWDGIPLLEGRFCAKKMLNRSDLKSFHEQLNAAVDKELGYHVSVLLDDSEAAKKALSKVPHQHLEAAKKELERQAEEAKAGKLAELEDREEDLDRREIQLDLREDQIADKERWAKSWEARADKAERRVALAEEITKDLDKRERSVEAREKSVAIAKATNEDLRLTLEDDRTLLGREMDEWFGKKDELVKEVAELEGYRDQLEPYRAQVEGLSKWLGEIWESLAEFIHHVEEIVAYCFPFVEHPKEFKGRLEQFPDNPYCRDALDAGGRFLRKKDAREARMQAEASMQRDRERYAEFTNQLRRDNPQVDQHVPRQPRPGRDER